MPIWFKPLCDIAEAVAYFCMLIPAVIARYSRSTLRGGMRPLAYLPVYLFGMFVLVRASAYFLHYNLLLIHLSTIGETLLYIKIYREEFIDRTTRQRIRITSVIFAFFAIIDSIWLEGFQQINSYTNLAESIIVISLSFLFFEKTITQKRKTDIHRIPMFVATVGIVIYLSGTVVLYLTTNYFITLNDEYNTRLMYLISSVLLLLLSLLLSRAFLLAKPNRAHTSS